MPMKLAEHNNRMKRGSRWVAGWDSVITLAQTTSLISPVDCHLQPQRYDIKCEPNSALFVLI